MSKEKADMLETLNADWDRAFSRIGKLDEYRKKGESLLDSTGPEGGCPLDPEPDPEEANLTGTSVTDGEIGADGFPRAEPEQEIYSKTEHIDDAIYSKTEYIDEGIYSKTEYIEPGEEAATSTEAPIYSKVEHIEDEIYSKVEHIGVGIYPEMEYIPEGGVAETKPENIGGSEVRQRLTLNISKLEQAINSHRLSDGRSVPSVPKAVIRDIYRHGASIGAMSFSVEILKICQNRGGGRSSAHRAIKVIRESDLFERFEPVRRKGTYVKLKGSFFSSVDRSYVSRFYIIPTDRTGEGSCLFTRDEGLLLLVALSGLGVGHMTATLAETIRESQRKLEYDFSGHLSPKEAERTSCATLSALTLKVFSGDRTIRKPGAYLRSVLSDRLEDALSGLSDDEAKLGQARLELCEKLTDDLENHTKDTLIELCELFGIRDASSLSRQGMYESLSTEVTTALGIMRRYRKGKRGGVPKLSEKFGKRRL